MIGIKFYKDDYELKAYAECAVWCNENDATIVDRGNYYECVAINIPLEDIKQAKISELKSVRDTEELSPIEYGGYIWDFDEKAQQRINGAIIALDNGGSLTWTSANNMEIKDVNAEDLRGVIGAAAIRSNTLHVKYRGLRAKVEEAETKEDVEKILWENDDKK